MSYLKIIFICMGNSCSSPMAEAIMQNLMVKTSLYWEIDSAALRGWNIGRRPHKYCLRVLHEHGLRSKHFCRMLTNQDFAYFDYIIPMSNHVHKELISWAAYNHITDLSKIISLSSFGTQLKGSSSVELSPTSKLKNFRVGYYKMKSLLKQLILSQNVEIIKYEIPSTDDDEEDGNEEINQTESIDSSGKNSMSVLETLETSSKTSRFNNVSPEDNDGPSKKCENCGQKYLPAL